MARKKKKKGGGGGGAPTWLITFSDMMTLMLTFFVLLVSMSVLDERRKLVVLASVTGAFGTATGSFNPMAVDGPSRIVEPGPMEMDSVNDLQPLKDLIWEDQNRDLNFQENSMVQILSINDAVLFSPGSFILTPSGVKLLDRILPWLLKVDHPLLLAGHTASQRAEAGQEYKVSFNEKEPAPTWRLSFMRVMAIYRYLTGRGLPEKNLKVEAFAHFRPRYDNKTPDGRRRNSRVDIVLDKRNREWIRKMQEQEQARYRERGLFEYKDFRFSLDAPVEGPVGGRLNDKPAPQDKGNVLQDAGGYDDLRRP
ncbi:OmpA/MotB family protein [Oleidesulfovibrio sp.]|uniref:OmpA/MotB family protein n=1 Tax=Oleidesulfovibrio sp. TaxID=2909707 RepID=UPI003A86152A